MSTDNLERWRAKSAEDSAKDARIAELEAQLQEANTRIESVNMILGTVSVIGEVAALGAISSIVDDKKFENTKNIASRLTSLFKR